MSAILALEKNGVVYMGADDVNERCGVNFYMNKEPNLKIKRMPGGILVGGAGWLRCTQYMFMHEEWFELGEGEVLDKRFIVKSIISRYYQATKNEEWNEDTDMQSKTLNVAFIIAKGKDIFTVYNDMSVVKCDGVAAISKENADDMLSAYAISSQCDDPELTIRRAFELVCTKSNDAFLAGHIINTKDLEFKRMEDVVC